MIAASCAAATNAVPTSQEATIDSGGSGDSGSVVEQTATAPEMTVPVDDLIISEIHYHPADDVAEFLELHNPTDSPIDLSGYSIADAIEVIFEEGTVPVGGYVIVSRSAEATEMAYGVSPTAIYTSKLSNRGERITLVAADGEVVDTVTYSDRTPWPEAPDGDGPSLELINATFDNDDVSNWRASTAPTPGAANSVEGTELVAAVSQIMVNPAQPEPSTNVAISAKVPADSATLVYQVGFDDPTTVDMDVSANVATATMPGQDAGTLVRYRIEAGGISAPTADDSIDFFGYVVSDPSVTPPIPRIDWFMDPAEFEDMIDNHLLDNQLFSTVIAYDGVVYDNVMVRPRGGDFRRTTFPKQSFEFEFPDGHDFIAPDLVPYPIDQFALGSQFGDWTMGREHASWSIMNETTGQPVHSAQTFLAQNGYFYGVYRFSEKLDGQWREANGLDGGEFYKANGLGGWAHAEGWEVKAPEGGSDAEINAVGARLRNDPAGPAKTAFLYENFDIPNIINYMATSVVLEHDDQTFQNFFVFHDTEGSGLYSVHPWDLDETFGPKLLCWEEPMTDTLCLMDPLFTSVMEVPEFEAMYWQRLRTLADTYLEPTLIEDRHAALIAEIGTALADKEATQWGRNPAYDMVDVFGWGVQERRDALESEPRLPRAQPAVPAIVIGEILPSPADGEAEVLELRNPSGSPVDLSGWTVDGVDLVIPGGTVIAAGGSVLLTDSIELLRATLASQNSIVIEYGGGLKGDGETITLTNVAGDVVVQVTYGEGAS